MKLLKVVCKVYDTSFDVNHSSYGYPVCSRCGKIIEGAMIEIYPNYVRDFRWKHKVFRYHKECIEESSFLLKMNYLGFVIAWKLYRLKKELVFVDTIIFKLRKLKELIKRILVRYESRKRNKNPKSKK